MSTSNFLQSAWLDSTPMQRIIFHWTAGTNKPNNLDLQHYHFLVDGNAMITRAVPVARNSSKGLQVGYAAHTLNCNTGAIAISLCGMAGAIEAPFDAGSYPINEPQLLKAIEIGRELASVYKISITPKTVLSHAEVQKNLGIQQRGKWDIAVFPWAANQFNTAGKCGDFIRSQIAKG